MTQPIKISTAQQESKILKTMLTVLDEAEGSFGASIREQNSSTNDDDVSAVK
jgi:hypothetical protein